MTLRRRMVLALLGLGLIARVNAAELEWTNPLADLTAGPEQRQVVAVFPFHNAGARSVKIASVKTSCGCTTAASDKDAYAPGEGGKVTATFTVGERTGIQEKIITVVTDAPNEKPMQLTLRVTIHEYVAVEPRRVVWKVGDDAVEKTIRCDVEEASSATVTGIRCSDPAISARVDAIAPGKSYSIHLRPVSTAKPVTALIELLLEISGAGHRTYRINAYILP